MPETLSDGAFSRASSPAGENKSAFDKAARDGLVLGSAMENKIGDGEFDELLKAEFIKLVDGMVRPR